MAIKEHLWKLLEINGNIYKSKKNQENLNKSREIMKITENPRVSLKSKKIYENLMKDAYLDGRGG